MMVELRRWDDMTGSQMRRWRIVAEATKGVLRVWLEEWWQDPRDPHEVVGLGNWHAVTWDGCPVSPLTVDRHGREADRALVKINWPRRWWQGSLEMALAGAITTLSRLPRQIETAARSQFSLDLALLEYVNTAEESEGGNAVGPGGPTYEGS